MKITSKLLAASLVLLLLLTACASQVGDPIIYTLQPTYTPLPTYTLLPTYTFAPPPTDTPTPTLAPPPTLDLFSTPPLTPASSLLPPTPSDQFVPPEGRVFATLADFWGGNAEWLLEVYDTGLPVGESDTIYRGGDEFWSYLHASYQSAGVVDQCGDPVPFPGCTTLWRSYDGGRHFELDTPMCLFSCVACPCDLGRDQVGQQQYPRVSFQADLAYMVYEHGAGTYLRTSTDGIHWSESARAPGTGAWNFDQGDCTQVESIGEHPHIYSEFEFDCLVGAPPGIYIEGDLMYIFVGLGRAPGHMGCYVGDRHAGVWGLQKCTANPLFSAGNGYGPVEVLGPEANLYFEFRTVSSADVVRVGDHYYMSYEGVRGPSDPTVVDNQFGLGFARSAGPEIDAAWEQFPGNPVISDLPGNVGVGHADIVIVRDATYLYTATSPSTRGRYVLVHR